MTKVTQNPPKHENASTVTLQLSSLEENNINIAYGREVKRDSIVTSDVIDKLYLSSPSTRTFIG